MIKGHGEVVEAHEDEDHLSITPRITQLSLYHIGIHLSTLSLVDVHREITEKNNTRSTWFSLHMFNVGDKVYFL